MVNIVSNPGAENGNSGWTNVAAIGGNDANQWVIVDGTAAYGCVHSGTYVFASASSVGVSMSQSLSLVVGATYAVSCWIGDASSASNFVLSIAGSPIISITGLSAPTAQYTGSFTASSISETLLISGSTTGGGSSICLDDISVTALATPTAIPTHSTSDVNNIYLSSLSNIQGFWTTCGGQYNYDGWAVSGLGDINNDGYDDIIIGSLHAYSVASISYIILGKPNGFVNGCYISFSINPSDPSATYSGYSVSGAGDINKDGFDDIIIGEPNAYSNKGVSHIIFGKASGFINLDLSNLTTTQGFSIFGANIGDQSGYSVSDAGDFNKDGYDDVIIGSPYASSNAGIVYIVFGKANNFTNINLATLTFPHGISIINSGGLGGSSVSGAGDVNGDGYDDIIIGSYGTYSYTGRSYVVFGSNRTTNINMNSLPNSQTLLVPGSSSGSSSGYSVSGAGDFNRDGYADIVIGEPGTSSNTGTVYVIFGKSNYTSNVDTATFPSSQGFSITGDGSFGYLGHSVSDAGDVNGDGYADIIIGAYAYSGNGNTGKSYIIFGKATGFTNIALSSLNNNQGFSILGANSGDYSGWSVSGLGDINRDGYADVIVGAYQADTGKGISYIIFGNIYLSRAPTITPTSAPTHTPTHKPTMLARTLNNINLGTLSTAQGYSIIGAKIGDASGVSVSYAGDVNGDGSPDIIIGASGYNSGEGKVYILYGRQLLDNINLANLSSIQGFTVTGNFGYFGSAVSGAGDVNGDGYDDVIIGASHLGSAGASYVIYGNHSLSDISITNFPSSRGFTITGIGGIYTGATVSRAGNVNGDRYDDIIIGAYYTAGYVIYGSSHPMNINLATLSSANGFAITGVAYAQNSVVNSAGDVNGDGYADIIIGGATSGTSYLIFGKLSGYTSINLSNLTITEGISIAGASTSANGVGDVNNDGYDDFMVGDFYVNSYSGIGYIIYGKAALSNINLANPLHNAQGVTINGASYDYLSAEGFHRAGDVNGDGYADIILGAYRTPLATPYAGRNYIIFGGNNLTNIALSTLTLAQGFVINGASAGDYSGNSASYAGDINGDGYADIIIGAYAADSGRGVSYVILNAAAASSPSAAPTVMPTPSPTPVPTHLPTRPTSQVLNIDLSLLNSAVGFSITGAHASDSSGYSVSSAGDVNGDGYSDIIIGARGASFGTGASYVIFGKKTGFSNIALNNLTINQGFSVAGAQKTPIAGAVGGSGYSVSSAGDVNKDGYDDIIIGANGENHASGNSYIVFGKASGFTNIDLATFTITQGYTIAGAVYDDQIGISVSKAGDINGDGYADVIIGSCQCSGDSPVGRRNGTSYVIFGKASGFSNINLATFTISQGFSIYGASIGAFSGESVSSAGDINGDGYSDVIIGAPYVSTSYVVFGKATGFSDIHLASFNLSQGFLLSTNPGTYAGYSVSGAGDINRDGYADVIIEQYNLAYVVFGKATGFSNVYLPSMSLNHGFTIQGYTSSVYNGAWVNAAGDVNGDGYADIIIGNPYALSNKGKSYIVFGKTSGFSNIDLTSLTSSQGFSITGVSSGDNSGRSVSGVGDINGDGYSDFIIGAYGTNSSTGTSYVIFGNRYQTHFPTSQPSKQPSIFPSGQPTFQPSIFLSTSLKNSLVAYYPFDGNANDESGNGNNGIVHSATLVPDRFGNVNSAYSFDGTSSYIYTAGAQFNFISNMSLSFWIKPSSSQSTWATIIDKTHHTTLNFPGGWDFVQNNNNLNSFFFEYVIAINDHVTPSVSTVNAETAQWNHIVVSKGSNINYFLNGVLVYAELISALKILSNNNYPLTIGASNGLAQSVPGSMSGYFNGSIDDIFIYNRTLSSAEVTLLYNFESPTSQPSRQPSRQPSDQPTKQPTCNPTGIANNNILNLVVDPGAEDGYALSGWTNSGGYTTHGWGAVTSHVHSGSYAFITMSNHANISQSLSLTVSATYTVSLWVMGIYGSGGNITSLYVNVGKNTIMSLTALYSYPHYIQYTSSFTASSATETLQISGNANYQLFLDDISVSVVSTANRVVNPGAETGDMTGWIDSGTIGTTGWIAVGLQHSGPHSGSYSFWTQSSTTATIIQSLSLAPFATYTVSFWAASGILNSLSLSIGSNTLISLTNIPSAYFAEYTSDFIINGATEALQISGSTAAGSWLNLDDISVTVTPNLVNNGGAELGMLGWSYSGTSDANGWVTYGTGAAHSGDLGFLTQSSSPVSMNQSLSLTAGTSYSASFWAKPANPGSYKLSLSVGGSDIISLTSLSGFYTQYNAAFTAGSEIEILQIIGSAPIFLDDIIVVALEAPTSQPSSHPTNQPIDHPSNQPTSRPTEQPIDRPSGQPSSYPSRQPSERPSDQPTSRPTDHPSDQPSSRPTSRPTERPSEQPSSHPSRQPTNYPSGQPTERPSIQPTSRPTDQATEKPSSQPSGHPTGQPTERPSGQPSGRPSMQPTSRPTSQPIDHPSMQPSAQPSSQPTEKPSVQPSDQPSDQPTLQPTRQPSGQPSAQPSMQPSSQPASRPTEHPTGQPSDQPSRQPTEKPSSQPTDHPSEQPSGRPSMQPTSQPTSQPIDHPSMQPSAQPSSQPTEKPSAQPTDRPSGQPNEKPSAQPTDRPSDQPSDQPSGRPTLQPIKQPSGQPSAQPSMQPSGQTTSRPTEHPTGQPSDQPSRQPTEKPSSQPTDHPSEQPSGRPSMQPTSQPTSQPIDHPSMQPSVQPSSQPTEKPSTQPTDRPSGQPSEKPSAQPTDRPSDQPSDQPSGRPTLQPIKQPSGQPSAQPSMQPSSQPTSRPTEHPTGQPSDQPSRQPAEKPSSQPSNHPSGQPTERPSIQPTEKPSAQPTDYPTGQPSSRPSDQPTEKPSTQPIDYPSMQPSDRPSTQPTERPSSQPSSHPSMQPSDSPSVQPLRHPTAQPSDQPSGQPSTQPSIDPTAQPKVQPSEQPTSQPSIEPATQPTLSPTDQPTGNPSEQPTVQPTSQPSELPTRQPTMNPSKQPYVHPSGQPSEQPSNQPTLQPTAQPSNAPTAKPVPTAAPTSISLGEFPDDSAISVIGTNAQFKIIFNAYGSYDSGNGFTNINVAESSAATNYVVFGGNSLKNINLAALSSSQGFSITPAISYDNSYRSVANAGDINGDGYDDLVVGVPLANVAYVLFGTTEGFVNMRQGFTIFGAQTGDQNGWSANNAGDFNGDTYADIIISAANVNYGTGAAYIIWGKKFGFTNIDLADLDPAQGIVISAPSDVYSFGTSVSGAGDVNGDGVDDVVISSASSEYAVNNAYIIFGRAGMDNIDAGSLSPTQGFIATATDYSYVPYSVSSAGDVNRDGYSDILIGSMPRKTGFTTQISYLIYGKAHNNNIDLNNLDAQGIVISGGGVVVSYIGDVNNDGFDDMMIGNNYDLSANGFVIFTPGKFTSAPSLEPTSVPSDQPGSLPTSRPSLVPSSLPSGYPSDYPTARPSRPTIIPTVIPTSPTSQPTSTPSNPTKAPTLVPTAPSAAPTIKITDKPTTKPTVIVTIIPSAHPSDAPSIKPLTILPSIKPTANPTDNPSQLPSFAYTSNPTKAPTKHPTLRPTALPTLIPSELPTILPTNGIASGGYITVNITDGGIYYRSALKTHFILNSTKDVKITGKGGHALFIVIAHPKVHYVITNFNQSSDLISLQDFKHIHSMRDLNFTMGSIILNLVHQQRIILSNLNLLDIAPNNFIFAPAEEQNKKPSNTGFIAGISAASVAMVALSSGLYYYITQDQPFKLDVKINKVVPDVKDPIDLEKNVPTKQLEQKASETNAVAPDLEEAIDLERNAPTNQLAQETPRTNTAASTTAEDQIDVESNMLSSDRLAQEVQKMNTVTALMNRKKSADLTKNVPANQLEQRDSKTNYIMTTVVEESIDLERSIPINNLLPETLKTNTVVAPVPMEESVKLARNIPIKQLTQEVLIEATEDKSVKKQDTDDSYDSDNFEVPKYSGDENELNSIAEAPADAQADVLKIIGDKAKSVKYQNTDNSYDSDNFKVPKYSSSEDKLSSEAVSTTDSKVSQLKIAEDKVESFESEDNSSAEQSDQEAEEFIHEKADVSEDKSSFTTASSTDINVGQLKTAEDKVESFESEDNASTEESDQEGEEFIQERSDGNGDKLSSETASSVDGKAVQLKTARDAVDNDDSEDLDDVSDKSKDSSSTEWSDQEDEEFISEKTSESESELRPALSASKGNVRPTREPSMLPSGYQVRKPSPQPSSAPSPQPSMQPSHEPYYTQTLSQPKLEITANKLGSHRELILATPTVKFNTPVGKLKDISLHIDPKAEVPKLEPNFVDNDQLFNLNQLIYTASNIRQLVEYSPIIKYTSKNIIYPMIENHLPESLKNITYPEILDNKIFLFTTHLAVGHIAVMLLPQESITNGLAISTAGSGSFGVRLAVSHYLSEQRQDALSQDKSMDAFEITKYCAATMLAYTLPSIATCAINKFVSLYQCDEIALSAKISLAGAECYSVYKASAKAVSTTADIVVPYIADGLVLMMSCASGSSMLSVVGGVVTTDYITRVAMDTVPNEIKESYIDPVLNNVNEVITSVTGNVYGCFYSAESNLD